MSYVVLKVVVLAVAACAAGRIELGTREKKLLGESVLEHHREFPVAYRQVSGDEPIIAAHMVEARAVLLSALDLRRVLDAGILDEEYRPLQSAIGKLEDDNTACVSRAGERLVAIEIDGYGCAITLRDTVDFSPVNEGILYQVYHHLVIGG